MDRGEVEMRGCDMICVCITIFLMFKKVDNKFITDYAIYNILELITSKVKMSTHHVIRSPIIMIMFWALGDVVKSNRINGKSSLA